MDGCIQAAAAGWTGACPRQIDRHSESMHGWAHERMRRIVLSILLMEVFRMWIYSSGRSPEPFRPTGGIYNMRSLIYVYYNWIVLICTKMSIRTRPQFEVSFADVQNEAMTS